MTSICICPVPERMISWVCGSRWVSSARSSSTRCCSACEAFCSSPLVLGRIAKEMTGAGRSAAGKMTGDFSSHSVSPLVVSLSLATATISPGSALAIGDCFLPSSRKSWPKRSRTPRVELSTVASLTARPETTRKIDSLPANGSITVLKTKAENGAAGSGARSTGSLLAPLKPLRAGRSLGAGSNASIASSSGPMPIFLRPEPHSTGVSLPATVAARSAARNSASSSTPLSRYFSSSASSVSATASHSRVRAVSARSFCSALSASSLGLPLASA